MIKLIIFDLDGVLVDAREMHYDALNRALSNFGYEITREEHLSTYDGLPTRKKLKLLTEHKGLDPSLYDEIWKSKQQETQNIITNEMRYDVRIRQILHQLKQEKYKICVASNSIRESVKMMLLRKGFIEYIDFFYSNEDVINPKPSAEMYMKCMIKAGVSPDETVVVEDSHIGRKAAIRSGCYLCAVRNPDDLTFDKIKESIMNANQEDEIIPKWQGGDLNILIPMAGRGSRFEQAGYTFPKPLIDVKGKPMIQVVVDNLNMDGKYIFIVQKEHYEKYNLQETLEQIVGNNELEIIQVDSVTEGAACTTLLAKEFINSDSPLIIANSDQYVEWDSNQFMYSMVADSIDGGILTFKSNHPKWSYVKLNDDRFVVEVAEKKPISNNATVGIYYWKHGSDYVKYAEQMIQKDIRTNNEFYVCPVYNEAIQDDKKIKIYEINNMWGLGTPEDLHAFLNEK